MALIATAAQWAAMNPVLAAGETGYETDTGKTKRGNGTSPWTSLAYDGSTYQLKDAIVEINGKTVISLDSVPAAVNYLRAIAAATGSPVTIRADGTDTDVGLVLRPRGVASTTIVDGSNNSVCKFGRASSAVNYVQMINAATGSPAKVYAGGTDTNVDLLLTGQGTTGRVKGSLAPRIGTTASSATPTINTDNYDQFNITALAAAITSMTTNLAGTPVDGQELWLRFTASAADRAITWGASFIGTLLATVLNGKTHWQRLRYDSVAAKWAGVYADTTGY